MVSKIATALVAMIAMPTALAHFNFDRLIVNGKPTQPYEYIRRMTKSNSPVANLKSTDMRCNYGTQANAAATKTFAVTAGQSVGFTVADSIGHPGPLFVYMSKVPADKTASTYDGSGPWFKVYALGVKNFAVNGKALVWGADQLRNFSFPLPKRISDGEYLVRAEHISIHGAQKLGGAQFYVSCAQVKVSGGAGGNPTPTVMIPGHYSANDPGLFFNPYYPPMVNYTMPGPSVYSG